MKYFFAITQLTNTLHIFSVHAVIILDGCDVSNVNKTTQVRRQCHFFDKETQIWKGRLENHAWGREFKPENKWTYPRTGSGNNKVQGVSRTTLCRRKANLMRSNIHKPFVGKIMKFTMQMSQDTTEWLLKLRWAERGEPQHILTSHWIIAREAEFVVVLPSQLIAVFPIIQDNLWMDHQSAAAKQNCDCIAYSY